MSPGTSPFGLGLSGIPVNFDYVSGTYTWQTKYLTKFTYLKMANILLYILANRFLQSHYFITTILQYFFPISIVLVYSSNSSLKSKAFLTFISFAVFTSQERISFVRVALFKARISAQVSIKLCIKV